MTKERFRELVKRFYPRAGVYTPNAAGPLSVVLKQWETQKRRKFNRCFCGTVTGGKHCHIHAIRGRRQAGLVAASLALLLFTGCSSWRLGPSHEFAGVPLPNKPKPILRSPKHQSLMPSRAVPVRATTATLTWDWFYCGANQPLPFAGLAFDVEETTDFKTWKKIATVGAPPFVVSTTNGVGYYRVGSHWVRTE